MQGTRDLGYLNFVYKMRLVQTLGGHVPLFLYVWRKNQEGTFFQVKDSGYRLLLPGFKGGIDGKCEIQEFLEEHLILHT